MRRFAILGALALMALVVVGTVSAASGPKATGDVMWIGGGGALHHAIFSAQPTVNGADGVTAGTEAKGQVSVWKADSYYYTGTVTCYRQVGTEAWFSGTVTWHSDGVTKDFFEIRVIDNVNGVGNSTPTEADSIGTTRLSDDPGTGCGTNITIRPVDIAGNVQVHGSTSAG